MSARTTLASSEAWYFDWPDCRGRRPPGQLRPTVGAHHVSYYDSTVDRAGRGGCSFRWLNGGVPAVDVAEWAATAWNSCTRST
jgi:hypothetical protein